MEVEMYKRSVFPVKRPNEWALYKEGQSYSWRADSINLSQEKKNYQNYQNVAAHCLIPTLTTNGISDSVIFRTLSYNLLKDLEDAETFACITIQISATNNHHEIYCRLLQHIVKEEMKTAYFNIIKNDGSFSDKLNWLRNNTLSHVERIVCFACIKGVFGWFRYVSILRIQVAGAMPGLTKSNELIMRDILLHMEMARRMYESLDEDERLDEERVKKIVQEAVNIEKNLAWSFSSGHEYHCYIEWCGERILEYLGYGIDTPLPLTFKWTSDIMPRREHQSPSLKGE